MVLLNNSKRLGFGAGGTWNALVSPCKLVHGAWGHVALTCDGSLFRLYLSGAEVRSHAPEKQPVFSSALQLGAETERINLPDGSADEALVKPLPGDLDQIAVFDRVPSPDEIASIEKSAR